MIAGLALSVGFSHSLNQAASKLEILLMEKLNKGNRRMHFFVKREI